MTGVSLPITPSTSSTSVSSLSADGTLLPPCEDYHAHIVSRVRALEREHRELADRNLYLQTESDMRKEDIERFSRGLRRKKSKTKLFLEKQEEELRRVTRLRTLLNMLAEIELFDPDAQAWAPTVEQEDVLERIWSSPMPEWNDVVDKVGKRAEGDVYVDTIRERRKQIKEARKKEQFRERKAKEDIGNDAFVVQDSSPRDAVDQLLEQLKNGEYPVRRARSSDSASLPAAKRESMMLPPGFDVYAAMQDDDEEDKEEVAEQFSMGCSCATSQWSLFTIPEEDEHLVALYFNDQQGDGNVLVDHYVQPPVRSPPIKHALMTSSSAPKTTPTNSLPTPVIPKAVRFHSLSPKRSSITRNLKRVFGTSRNE